MTFHWSCFEEKKGTEVNMSQLELGLIDLDLGSQSFLTFGREVLQVFFLFSEHLSPQMLIFVGVTVGIVLTILFMTMIILYCVKTQACCCRLDSSSKHKPSDIER